MKFISFIRILLLLTPLSFAPAAEGFPELIRSPIPWSEEGLKLGLEPPGVNQVPEATSWSLALGALGSFLLIRKRY